MDFTCECGKQVEYVEIREDEEQESSFFTVCPCGKEKEIPVNSGEELQKLISEMKKNGIKFLGEEEVSNEY